MLYWLAVATLFALTRDIATGLQGYEVRWTYTAIDAVGFLASVFQLSRRRNRKAARA